MTTLNDDVSVPLQLSFRHLDPSAAVEARVRRHVERLSRKGKLEWAHVVVDARRASSPSAATYTAHVQLDGGGRSVVASRDCDPDRSHASVWIAIRDAMDAAERQLGDAHDRRVCARRARPADPLRLGA